MIHVTADMLGTHHKIGPAIGLAGDDGDARHGGLAEGVDQLGAVLDDAAVLLVGAGQKSGHIFVDDQRNVEGSRKNGRNGRP